MKNLLNCHTKNVHSFPISFEDGLYRRIFYADYEHDLWKPIEVAIHPHHVDIKITILDGELWNPIFELSNDGDVFKKYFWDSHILNGKGGFERIGEDKLSLVSNIKYKTGETFEMSACQMHTVQIERGKKCVWLIEERKPTCEYFPINYSKNNLEEWKTDGLYIECDEITKEKYLKDYLNKLVF